MSTWIVIAAVALLVLGLLVGGWAYQTANRLDRLHVRYDLSWQALDGALARRAVVARAVAVDAYPGVPEGKRLAKLADAAERAPRPAREAAENELSAALSAVDPAELPVALVVAVALGGSRARGTHRTDSDFDLGVYYDRGRLDLEPVAAGGQRRFRPVGRRRAGDPARGLRERAVRLRGEVEGGGRCCRRPRTFGPVAR